MSNIKKIFYWSPHISNVATIKNVINSMISLKSYSKKPLDVSIIDVIGEWSKNKDQLSLLGINFIEMKGLKLTKFLPITGFIKSRIIFLLISFTKFFSLKKILKKENPEYLIIHLITALPLTLLIFFNFETKFILRISGLPNMSLLRKTLWKMISKKIYLVSCPSNQTRDDLIKLNIFPKDKLKILYDPILQVRKINKDLKNKQIINFCDKNFFLNIGRLTKQKNQILLIKAFSEILLKNRDLILLIAGEGEERVNLEKYINLKNLNNNIHLLGHIENVYPYIKKSLAVISSSKWEDPGAVMIEASFCNKNVISSDCPNGPKEFLSNGKSGYLFKNNNQKDLVNKINLFLNDSDKERLNKIILSKKKSENYTIFNHYKLLDSLLNMSNKS